MLVHYEDRTEGTIYLLFLYRKSDQEDLSPQQSRILSRLIRKELMKEDDVRELVESIQEAAAIKRGRRARSRPRACSIGLADIEPVRKRLHCFPIRVRAHVRSQRGALQNWEQVRRHREGQLGPC